MSDPSERLFSPAPLQGGIPKYRQLAEIIRSAIMSGQLQAGSRLPPITRLATQYAVSLGTVRQAMALLDREGLIVSQQGRGTFVNSSTSPSVPFVLVNFDPTRAAAAATAILEMAESRQVLFFTCHPTVVEAFRSQAPELPVYEIAGADIRLNRGA